ncbi:MAG TPA: hypothetical protein VIE66_16055 [Methylocella sp.]
MLASRAAAIALPALILSGAAACQEDPWLAIQPNASGATNYVRRSEIEAFADVSPSNCMLILSDGEEIRVFQKCAPVAAVLKNERLVSFPNEFGMVFVTVSSIFDLVSTNTSGCRLNLKNRKFVSVNQSCESTYQALPRE